MRLYPNWDMHEYLRFDLIHQLITTISRRWCGTKAEITAPWRLRNQFVGGVHAGARVEPTGPRLTHFNTRLCVPWRYDQKVRLIDWLMGILPNVAISVSSSELWSQLSPVMLPVTLSLTVTHIKPSHRNMLQPWKHLRYSLGLKDRFSLKPILWKRLLCRPNSLNYHQTISVS